MYAKILAVENTSFWHGAALEPGWISAAALRTYVEFRQTHGEGEGERETGREIEREKKRERERRERERERREREREMAQPCAVHMSMERIRARVGTYAGEFMNCMRACMRGHITHEIAYMLRL